MLPQVRSSVAAVRSISDRDLQEVLLEAGAVVPLTKLMQGIYRLTARMPWSSVPVYCLVVASMLCLGGVGHR